MLLLNYFTFIGRIKKEFVNVLCNFRPYNLYTKENSSRYIRNHSTNTTLYHVPQILIFNT